MSIFFIHNWISYVIWIDRATIWIDLAKSDFCARNFSTAHEKHSDCAHSFFIACVRKILAVDAAVSFHFNSPFLGKNWFYNGANISMIGFAVLYT